MITCFKDFESVKFLVDYFISLLFYEMFYVVWLFHISVCVFVSQANPGSFSASLQDDSRTDLNEVKGHLEIALLEKHFLREYSDLSCTWCGVSLVELQINKMNRRIQKIQFICVSVQSSFTFM